MFTRIGNADYELFGFEIQQSESGLSHSNRLSGVDLTSTVRDYRLVLYIMFAYIQQIAEPSEREKLKKMEAFSAVEQSTDIDCEESLRKRYLSSLQKATQALLDPQNEPGVLNGAIGDLYTLFSGITGIKSESESSEDVTDTLLGQGLALSPRGAARCIFHFERTARFLRGLKGAIIQAQQHFPNQTIHVLYAGCGPYATLFIPLTTQFKADEVRFTLLDIHRRSLDAVQGLAETLGVSAYIRDSIECDAAEYRHSGEPPIHVIVTEVMQKALIKEPQVAVTLNLAPQLCEGGIFIPEKIALDICVAEVINGMPQLHEPDSIRIDLGRVFEITPETTSFPPVKLQVPVPLSENKMLCILTQITVFDSITLDGMQTWLTHPTPLPDTAGMDEGTEVEFCYSMSQYPKLDYKVLPA